MKALILILSLCLATGASASALNCTTADGATVLNGDTVRLYYSPQPRKSIGPNYLCEQTSRLRVCLNGEFSRNEIVCDEMDSGGCVAWWIDVLDDSSFAFATCSN